MWKWWRIYIDATCKYPVPKQVGRGMYHVSPIFFAKMDKVVLPNKEVDTLQIKEEEMATICAIQVEDVEATKESRSNVFIRSVVKEQVTCDVKPKEEEVPQLWSLSHILKSWRMKPCRKLVVLMSMKSMLAS